MSLPLIDLSPVAAAHAAGAACAIAARIDAALREDGFFAVIGHGVPAAVIEAAFAAGHAFFALPEGTKRRWHIDGWPLKRGFDPVGWQALDPGTPPDIKESFYLGVEAIGPNQWPDAQLLPNFKTALTDYSRHMEALARRLMGHFEQALGLPPAWFNPHMLQPTCTTRLLHYPPQPVVVAPGQIGCGAHTDWGALTLLAQDGAGGLQVQRADGAWLDVTPITGALVVNAGDLTQRWTNDRWRSTVHRVVNKHPDRERFSIAYFYDMDATARIEPLPSCVSATHPARYGPLTAGEHLSAMYRKTTVRASA